MATIINNKAGIRDTFAACPDLKAVYVLENGDHYFNKKHAEHMARKKVEGEGEDAKQVLDEKITTIKKGDKDLEDEAPATPEAPAAPATPAK
ncbi:hypothetical protein [Hymenobacter negativus]|uniref:Uncharacterized protein n=1 Tax=Hymenobacter negativus TaxID=2795026 RepID=A0ABS3QD74_9BACT|nr:hypothetical protein [Hymenobacter negativus]MBO2009178.1 hypothetical protein [Hymenobacter negativus]